MIQDLVKQTKEKMNKSIESLTHELSKLRTGRASLMVLDGIKVDYYGTLTPLNQVASLSIPEPRLIAIQPWEANIIPEIEKSIVKANIGLTPSNDGRLIRLAIPQLTEDRRKEIVKSLKSHGEEARVAVRQIRRNANEDLKKLEKDSQITEDDLKRATTDVQKLTDEIIEKIDKIVIEKEKDIMTI